MKKILIMMLMTVIISLAVCAEPEMVLVTKGSLPSINKEGQINITSDFYIGKYEVTWG